MGKDQFGIQKVMRGSDYFADSMGQFALMTLEDKIKLCSGANFWESESMEQYGIPSFFMSDGPYGLRTEKGESDHLGINQSEQSTCFPTASASAAS